MQVHVTMPHGVRLVRLQRTTPARLLSSEGRARVLLPKLVHEAPLLVHRVLTTSVQRQDRIEIIAHPLR